MSHRQHPSSRKQIAPSRSLDTQVVIPHTKRSATNTCDRLGLFLPRQYGDFKKGYPPRLCYQAPCSLKWGRVVPGGDLGQGCREGEGSLMFWRLLQAMSGLLG